MALNVRRWREEQAKQLEEQEQAAAEVQSTEEPEIPIVELEILEPVVIPDEDKDDNSEDGSKADEGIVEVEEIVMESTAGEPKPEYTGPKSRDFNAKNAARYIEDHTPEELVHFLSEDENRVTVIRIYEPKMGK